MLTPTLLAAAVTLILARRGHGGDPSPWTRVAGVFALSFAAGLVFARALGLAGPLSPRLVWPVFLFAVVAACTARGAAVLLEEIKADLRDFGVVFDSWFSEKSLFDSGEVTTALERLRAGGYLYEDGKAVGFRATDFGDEKDRVIVKGDGEFTYFASDSAYHRDKIEKGFDEIVDIWGADHHGYTLRVPLLEHPARVPEQQVRECGVELGQVLAHLEDRLGIAGVGEVVGRAR